MQRFNSESPKMAPILSSVGAKQQTGSKLFLLLATADDPGGRS